MDVLIDYIQVLYVLLLLFGIILIGCFAVKLTKWAKQRKAAAVIFGAAVQMFLPDPYAQRTIKMVQEEKQEQPKKQKQKEGNDPNKG